MFNLNTMNEKIKGVTFGFRGNVFNFSWPSERPNF